MSTIVTTGTATVAFTVFFLVYYLLKRKALPKVFFYGAMACIVFLLFKS